jgi:hypothetical protein
MGVLDWSRVDAVFARLVFEMALLADNLEVSRSALSRLEFLKADEPWMKPVLEWNFALLSLSELATRLGASLPSIKLLPLRFVVLAAVAEERNSYTVAAENLESLSRLNVYSENIQQKVVARAKKMRAMAQGDVISIDRNIRD